MARTVAGKLADEREVRFVRLDESWRGTPRIVWSVDCVDCSRPFEAMTGHVLRFPKTRLAYNVNWRCVDCRSPENVERGRRIAAKNIGRQIASDLV